MKILALSLIAAFLLSCTSPQQGPTAVQHMSAAAFKEQKLSESTVLLDVRTAEEFASGHLTGAQNVDFRSGDFAQQFKSWDKHKVYYLYCASGNRSGKAAELMHAAGFKHIYNIGGYAALKEAGLPTGQQE